EQAVKVVEAKLLHVERVQEFLEFGLEQLGLDDLHRLFGLFEVLSGEPVVELDQNGAGLDLGEVVDDVDDPARLHRFGQAVGDGGVGGGNGAVNDDTPSAT